MIRYRHHDRRAQPGGRRRSHSEGKLSIDSIGTDHHPGIDAVHAEHIGDNQHDDDRDSGLDIDDGNHDDNVDRDGFNRSDVVKGNHLGTDKHGCLDIIGLDNDDRFDVTAPTTTAASTSSSSADSISGTASVLVYINGQPVNATTPTQTSATSSSLLSAIDALFASIGNGEPAASSGSTGSTTSQLQIWNA